MRTMNENELEMYKVLFNSKTARMDNYEACREFYKKVYNVDFPDLKGYPNFFTIERSVRMLKSEYAELTDTEEREVKLQKMAEYKERALDRNKPVKNEEIQLGGIYW